jgi:hypothetical protein
MAGLITTGSAPKSLWPGVFSWWGAVYDQFDKLYDKMFDIEQSKKNYEELVAFAGLGFAQLKPDGKGIAYDDMKQGATTRAYNLTYALGYMITEEAIEDNQYPSELNALGKDAGRTLATSCTQTIETIAANVYNNAFAAGVTFGDGVCLINTAHPGAKGLNFSNTLTVAADLSEVALEQANIQIKRYKNDAGLLVNLKPQKLILPPELEYEANRILNSVLQNDTANNAINALKATGAYPGGIVINPFLTDAKTWFIRTNVLAGKGMTGFERIKPSISPDNDFETGNAKFKCRFRMSFTNGDPRSIFGVQGP